MANPHRGEASFEVGDQVYRLRFTWNAAVAYEEKTRSPLSDALADVAERRLSATSIRAMLWAGLQEHHASLSIAAVGRLLDEIGRTEALRLLGVGLRYYFPEIAAEESGPDPQAPAPSP